MEPQNKKNNCLSSDAAISKRAKLNVNTSQLARQNFSYVLVFLSHSILKQNSYLPCNR